jgi:serine/threonine protein kinase
LDYAGERGVVHRDVKRANFLLAGRVGPEECVLLGDFGIARALGGAGFTVTGSVMGTLSYAALERANRGQCGRPGSCRLGLALVASARREVDQDAWDTRVRRLSSRIMCGRLTPCRSACA